MKFFSKKKNEKKQGKKKKKKKERKKKEKRKKKKKEEEGNTIFLSARGVRVWERNQREKNCQGCIGCSTIPCGHYENNG